MSHTLLQGPCSKISLQKIKARLPYNKYTLWESDTLREKCPNTEFSLVRIFLYSDWIQKKTDQKNCVFGHFSHSDKEWVKQEIQWRKMAKLTCS